MSMSYDIIERIAKLKLPIDERVSLLLGIFNDLEWWDYFSYGLEYPEGANEDEKWNFEQETKKSGARNAILEITKESTC